MAAPQERLRSGPFRVEVQRPEDIYTMLARSRLHLFHLFELKDKAERGIDVSDEEETKIPPIGDDIELADVEFTDGLYSRFMVYATPLIVPNHELVTVFNLRLHGYYRNPEIHGEISAEEAEKLRGLLSNIYGKSTRHFEMPRSHLFRIDDEYEQTTTGISLAHDPDVSVADSWLYMTLADIANPPLNLHMSSYKYVPLRNQDDFVRKMGKWAQHIEDTVTAIAQVKGIPQTGVLTLRPPQRIETQG